MLHQRVFDGGLGERGRRTAGQQAAGDGRDALARDLAVLGDVGDEVRSVDRGEALQQRGRQRDADAPAQLPHQVEEPGAVGNLAHREIGEGEVRQRHEDEAQADPSKDERPEEVRHPAVGRVVRVLPHRQREDPDARRDGPAPVEFPLLAPHDRHRERARQRARQDHEARLVRGEVLQVLQVDRQHEHGRVQAHAQHEPEYDAHGELPALQDPEVHDGMRGPQLVPDEGHERDRADDREDRHFT